MRVQRDMVYRMTVNLLVEECPVCGIVYGVPKTFDDHCYDNGGTFYCPNGHELGWSETKADRERKRAEKAERELAAERDGSRRLRAQRDTALRSAAAHKGHATKIRKRIAAGVCPVPGCTRSGFTRVRSHIAAKHPDWHEHDPKGPSDV